MNGFVDYLNSTNNVGGNSMGSLAEAQVKSPYFDSIKVDRKVGLRITKEIEQNVHKAYILTGHAGDGKTSILVQVLKALELLPSGEGLDTFKEYDHLFYVKDMSEIPEKNQVSLLEKVLEAPKNGKTGILISNTGPLLKSMLTLEENKKNENGSKMSSEERIELQSKILMQLDKNEDKEILVAGYSVVLVNIARVDNVSFAKRILQKMLSEDLWSECSNCPSKDNCPILNNKKLLTTQFDRVSTFIENFYRFLYENDKRMTIRQMVGQISYGITGDLTCVKISNNMLKEPMFTYNFANLFFGYKGLSFDKDSQQIKGIDYIKNLGLDKIALDVDYRLFVNHDYSFFTSEIRSIIEELSKKSRKHFQIIDESIEEYSNQQIQTAKIRSAIRRFYLVFGIETEEYTVDGTLNQLFGTNYCDYKKLITSSQPSSMTRKIQNVVYNALYIKNTGFLPIGNAELPLTLRREDEVYQSVLLVLGIVSKSEIKVITQKVNNDLEDADQKYELFIQLKESLFKLSLPMLNYFNDLIDGAVSSNSNPALSHGITALDTLLLEKFGDRNLNGEDDCELSVIVNTTSGQKIKHFDFNDNYLHIID